MSVCVNCVVLFWVVGAVLCVCFVSFCCSLLFLFVVYWGCVVVLLLCLKPFSAACNKRAYRSCTAGTFWERVTGVVGVQVLVVCRHIGKPAGENKQLFYCKIMCIADFVGIMLCMAWLIL